MANSDKQKKNDDLSNDKGNTNKKSKTKKEPSKSKIIFKNLFLTILITGLIVSVLGIGYVFAVIKNAPELDINAILNLNQPSMLFDNKEQFIDNLPTEEERYIITYDKMPINLVNAYIAIEDERFLTHKGIDPRRLVGSSLGNIKYLLTGEGMTSGASTLTQQLLKNTILFEEASAEESYIDKINRKIKEIYLALQLEKQLSKQQIIEAYLNTIPLGGKAYGVEAASKYFFGKPAEQLSLTECAYIAGITQMPTYYSAYNTEEEGYPNTYIDRTKTVLMKMKELGFISEDEYNLAYADVEANNFTFKPQKTDYRVNYEWFVYPTLEQVRSDLKEKYKYTDEEVNKLFMNGGLKIYTTMDRTMQDSIQSVLDNRENFKVSLHTGVLEQEILNGKYATRVETDSNGNTVKRLYDANNNLIIDDLDTEGELTLNGIPFLQSSATVMDYKTGKVVALIGGRGEQPAHSLNRAYDTLKPIASTTKPITVYGPAIDTKLITAATPIDDAPVSSSITDKYQAGWTINNWDKKFDGIITPREAIGFSKNVTSVKVIDKMGFQTALDYGRKAGIVYNEVSETSMSAIALGQHDNRNGSDGGNTTIMASAFGAFGNSGVRTEPILYTKVLDSTGKIILDKEAETVKLFSPQTAYIMYNILKEPAKFDAGSAKFGNIPVSGKTGTTSDVDYFWFSGLTPYYSASVWIGYDIPLTMNGYSSSAAYLWGKVMAPVHDGLENIEIEKPSGISTATICMDSGKLATDICSQDPRKSRVRSEMFIEGTEPKSVCDVHVKVKVNKQNNKLATENTPKELIEERVFIKKENASKAAADYPFVLPTEKDDTKPVEMIKLSQIGIKENMDLYDAIVILNDKQIKYTFKGLSVSGTLNPKTYTLLSFTPEIKKDGTVELVIKKNEETGVGGGQNPPPTENPPSTQNPPSTETPHPNP